MSASEIRVIRSKRTATPADCEPHESEFLFLSFDVAAATSCGGVLSRSMLLPAPVIANGSHAKSQIIVLSAEIAGRSSSRDARKIRLLAGAHFITLGSIRSLSRSSSDSFSLSFLFQSLHG